MLKYVHLKTAFTVIEKIVNYEKCSIIFFNWSICDPSLITSVALSIANSIFNTIATFIYKVRVINTLEKAATYDMSKQHCVNQGRRLCHAGEICTNNKPIYGIIARDAWVAANDRHNEWVQIGNGELIDVLVKK